MTARPMHNAHWPRIGSATTGYVRFGRSAVGASGAGRYLLGRTSSNQSEVAGIVRATSEKLMEMTAEMSSPDRDGNLEISLET